jgi:hypothetical protein
MKNVFWVKEPIFQKRRIITHEVANMLRISFASHQIILTDNLNTSDFRETCVPCTEWEAVEESHQHMPLSFNSCFKKTQNTLWRQSQVMKCRFTGLTQHSNTSSLKYQSMFAVSFHIYGVVYLWMCFTRSNCKPTLLHWHLTAPVGKCQVEMTWLHGLTGYWFLHYNNTPAHYALSVHKIMAKNDCHSILSLLTMSYVFFLFPKLTMTLKRRFNITISQQNCGLNWVPNDVLHKMLWTAAWSLGSRKLLWMRQHSLEGRPKCCYGEINSLWKLCEHSM